MAEHLVGRDLEVSPQLSQQPGERRVLLRRRRLVGGRGAASLSPCNQLYADRVVVGRVPLGHGLLPLVLVDRRHAEALERFRLLGRAGLLEETSGPELADVLLFPEQRSGLEDRSVTID